MSTTPQEINWLANPVEELRSHPDDTLILMRRNSGLLQVGKLKVSDSDNKPLKVQCHPNLAIVTVESMVTRGATFALLGGCAAP